MIILHFTDQETRGPQKPTEAKPLLFFISVGMGRELTSTAWPWSRNSSYITLPQPEKKPKALSLTFYRQESFLHSRGRISDPGHMAKWWS